MGIVCKSSRAPHAHAHLSAVPEPDTCALCAVFGVAGGNVALLAKHSCSSNGQKAGAQLERDAGAGHAVCGA